MDVESNGGQPEPGDDVALPVKRSSGPADWLRNTNRNPDIVSFLRRARRVLPGDPDFGDPLSTAGEGGPQAAARAADRILEREAATRELSLATLQLWQAVTERASGRPANAEVTIVFTDLVGFSGWSLRAGDEATLRLLRRVAQVAEPPLLDAGGHIVKRMGDGIMATFRQPATALAATLEALEAMKSVDVGGYTPRMRAGIHTGRPQRIGGDWLGVDVNIAARVMERAVRGGLIVSEPALQGIGPQALEELGVSVRRVRRQVFGAKQSGVPPELVMYWVKADRAGWGNDESDESDPDDRA